jgi:hypothetical protein
MLAYNYITNSSDFLRISENKIEKIIFWLYNKYLLPIKKKEGHIL